MNIYAVIPRFKATDLLGGFFRGMTQTRRHTNISMGDCYPTTYETYYVLIVHFMVSQNESACSYMLNALPATVLLDMDLN